MGQLRGSNGSWLVDNVAKVDGLVRDVFGVPGEDHAPWVGEGLAAVFTYSCGEVRGWVLRALRRTKNGSAHGPDGISYQLIKAVRDTRLEAELVEEVVDNLVRCVPSRRHGGR